jgi:arsenate reductase
MKKVLFICIHNSARSQIAEALLKKYGGDLFEAESGGFEKGTLNPYAIRVLQQEEDIDISNNSVDSLFDMLKAGKLFSYVITVCDEGNAQKCPVFPGLSSRIHWSFEDPSSFEGTDEEIYEKVKEIYKKIKKEVLAFIELAREKL